MAKIKEGILGALSGKLGPVVGAKWKGIPYLRTLPQKSKKGKCSQGQIATQEKMRFINKFLVPFHPYITIGMKNEAAAQTEVSAAFKANYHHAVTGIHPDLGVDYSKFIFSTGTLPMVDEMTVRLISSNVIEANWLNVGSGIQKYNDQMMLVYYCSELHKAGGIVGGVDRAAKRCTVELKAAFVGKPIEVFASITSFDRKLIANNIYLGRLDPTSGFNE
jgi:hypothetical protein